MFKDTNKEHRLFETSPMIVTFHVIRPVMDWTGRLIQNLFHLEMINLPD